MKKILLATFILLSVFATAQQDFLPIGINKTALDYSTGNLNNLTAIGFYRGSGLVNAPDNGWWYITVEAHDNTGGTVAGWTKQTAASFGAGNTYSPGTTFVRNQIGGTEWTPWTMLVRLNKDGNLGIGIASPVERLHVNGNVALERGSAIFFGGNIYTTGEYIYEAPFGTIKIHSGGNDAIVIPNNDNVYLSPNAGSVGIGTTTPGAYKLAVEGTIGARKVKVTQSAWADYVFDSSYNLPSLSHIETFIQQNKHLPEVPSAADVKKDGLDLGDNQAILLKKIEELTLYIIRQNKQILQQSEQLNKQTEEMEKVKRRLVELETRQ